MPARPRPGRARLRRRPGRDQNERSLVAWLASRSGTRGLVGDDAAMLGARSEHVVTVDFQIAGVHFPRDLDAAVVARRLVAVNLSDLAAMGARPVHGFLALSAPRGFPHRRFFSALLREAERYGFALAGGDLASSADVHAALVLIGERWPGTRRWLRRAEARAGDLLYLGGGVGESALGLELVRRGARVSPRGVELPAKLELPSALARTARRAVRRHLLPTPQLELGRWLVARERGAAIDVSDGVARDLHRLCEESGVGASLEAALLPSAPRQAELAGRLGLEQLRLQLGGGEDYVLLFTLPAGTRVPPRLAVSCIGRIEERTRGVTLVESDGSRRPLPDLGWDHLRPDREEGGSSGVSE